MRLTFVAERPPSPRFAYQEVLVAAEANEYLILKFKGLGFYPVSRSIISFPKSAAEREHLQWGLKLPP